MNEDDKTLSECTPEEAEALKALAKEVIGRLEQIPDKGVVWVFTGKTTPGLDGMLTITVPKTPSLKESLDMAKALYLSHAAEDPTEEKYATLSPETIAPYVAQVGASAVKAVREAKDLSEKTLRLTVLTAISATILGLFRDPRLQKLKNNTNCPKAALIFWDGYLSDSITGEFPSIIPAPPANNPTKTKEKLDAQLKEVLSRPPSGLSGLNENK